MSQNNDTGINKDSKMNAFRLLRTSLEASQHLRNSTIIKCDNSKNGAPLEEKSIFKQKRPSLKPHADVISRAHNRKYHSSYDIKAVIDAKADSSRAEQTNLNEQLKHIRVDPETLEGKKVATVKDRARLRDLIKNI